VATAAAVVVVVAKAAVATAAAVGATALAPTVVSAALTARAPVALVATTTTKAIEFSLNTRKSPARGFFHGVLMWVLLLRVLAARPDGVMDIRTFPFKSNCCVT